MQRVGAGLHRVGGEKFSRRRSCLPLGRRLPLEASAQPALLSLPEPLPSHQGAGLAAFPWLLCRRRRWSAGRAACTCS